MRGDGKGVAKGETQRGEKSAHHAVRHGVLFSLMGFPLRKKTYAERSSAMSGGFPVDPGASARTVYPIRVRTLIVSAQILICA
jgi:hypothetical protein